jgi:hypothetical protein
MGATSIPGVLAVTRAGVHLANAIRARRRAAMLSGALMAAVALAAGTARAQTASVPVVLTLRELGLEIEREKVLEADTHRVHRVNRLRKPDGTFETLDDQQVLALAREDARKYRERAGALHRGLVEEVTRAAVEPPVFVAVFAPIDPTKLPRRLSTAELRGLDPDELEAWDGNGSRTFRTSRPGPRSSSWRRSGGSARRRSNPRGSRPWCTPS